MAFKRTPGRFPSKLKYGRMKRVILDFVSTEQGRQLSRTEVARKFHTTPGYVSQICRQAGMGRNYHMPRKSKSDEAEVLDGPKADLGKVVEAAPAPPKETDRVRRSETSDVQEIVQDGTLSVPEQRKKLSWLAQFALRDEAKVAAHRALQQLDQATGVQTRLGPGEPLTHEDRAFRLSLLMEACGQEVTTRAFSQAFGLRISGTEASDAGGDVPAVDGARERVVVSETVDNAGVERSNPAVRVVEEVENDSSARSVAPGDGNGGRIDSVGVERTPEEEGSGSGEGGEGMDRGVEGGPRDPGPHGEDLDPSNESPSSELALVAGRTE